MKLAILSLILLPIVAHAEPPIDQFGRVSYYGHECDKKPMANGKRFNPDALTAASFDYPLGTVLEVTNMDNQKHVRVTVTDRGPAQHLGRLVDLSEAAAIKIGSHHAGVVLAEIHVVSIPCDCGKICGKFHCGLKECPQGVK